MKFYKYILTIVFAMILIAISTSAISATETQISTDLETINDEDIELNSNKDTVNQRLRGNNRINSISNNDANIYSFNITCESDFQDLSKYLKSSNNTYDCINLNITNDISITSSNVLSENSKRLLVINGNHHTIKVSNPSDYGENHFLTCGENGKVVINNLTFTGFNSAIVNYGNVELQRVIFNSNRVNYMLDSRDIGGAIRNSRVLNCIDCSFIKNYAKFGGAIFSNSTGSIVNLINCYFNDNEAYAESNIGHSFCSHFWNSMASIHNYIYRENEAKYVCPGKDVFIGCGGTIYSYALNPPPLLNNSSGFFCTPNNQIKFGYDDSELGHTIVLRDSNIPVVREYVISNKTDLQKVVNEINNLGTTVDKFVINFTSTVNFNPWTENLVLFNPQYGSILINGNGHNVNLLGARECDEYHFTTLNKNVFMVVNNLGISGFNCAIVNNGYACFNNVTFSNNKIKYIIESGDGGGAINNYGVIVCNNCTFINNFGLWAGAIYGGHSAEAYLNNCTFDKNTPFKDDGCDLYSYNNAKFYLNGVEVNSTAIKDTYISIGFGQLPSGITKVLYNYLNIITPIISIVTGFVAGVGSANPSVGIVVGTTVGTVLGVSCNIGYRLYYAGLSHEFSYNILTHLPIDIAIHFTHAISGATIGAKISLENKISKAINSEKHIEELHTYESKNLYVKYADGSIKTYKRISLNRMDPINKLLRENRMFVRDWTWKTVPNPV